MTEAVNLTPSQKDFLARACAFIASRPPQEDVEKLLVFAALQLPETVVDFLRQQAKLGNASDLSGARLEGWLQ